MRDAVPACVLVTVCTRVLPQVCPAGGGSPAASPPPAAGARSLPPPRRSPPPPALSLLFLPLGAHSRSPRSSCWPPWEPPPPSLHPPSPQGSGTCWRHRDRCRGWVRGGPVRVRVRVCALACGCLRGGGGRQPAQGCNCWRPWSANLRRRHLRKGAPAWAAGWGPGRQADPGAECLQEWVTPG